MKAVYIFSGLGADERVLQEIDLSGYQVIFVQWIAPLPRERIEDYGKRLSRRIDAYRPVLIGLSFGGMIAVEVAKFVETEKIILIASVKTRKEIPFYYRLAGLLGIHSLLPMNLLLRPTIFTNWAFGVTSQKDKKLLADILRSTEPAFFRWAIREIVRWKNSYKHKSLVHIHGKSDRVFPYLFVRPDIAIAGGGHFMTVNKAEEITAIVRGLLV
jgi:pimeloyl-ACP methyl ester carboxylesterase